VFLGEYTIRSWNDQPHEGQLRQLHTLASLPAQPLLFKSYVLDARRCISYLDD